MVHQREGPEASKGGLWDLCIKLKQWNRYSTWHLSSSNVTVQPALHKTRIPKSNAVVMPGIMWPVRTVGKPGMVMLQMCVDTILRPSSNVAVTGLVAWRLF